jgi:hypothetical protein
MRQTQLVILRRCSGSVLAQKYPVQGSLSAILRKRPIDSLKSFTLEIPLPDTTGLMLSSDPLNNLSIIYFVKKASQGSASFSGIIPRSQIDTRNGNAKFSATFFGTYQAIITTAPIEKAIEKPIEPALTSKPAPAKRGSRHDLYTLALLAYAVGLRRLRRVVIADAALEKQTDIAIPNNLKPLIRHEIKLIDGDQASKDSFSGHQRSTDTL